MLVGRGPRSQTWPPGPLRTRRGRATLLITHEMDGLDQVDEIVVLDGGRVVQRGTHQALLAAGGLYERMWAAARVQEA